MTYHSFYGYKYGVKIKSSKLNRLHTSQPIEPIIELSIIDDNGSKIINIPRKAFEIILEGFIKTIKEAK